MNAQDLKNIITEFYDEPVELESAEELKDHIIDGLTAKIVEFQLNEICQNVYGCNFDSLPADDQRNMQYLFDMGVFK